MQALLVLLSLLVYFCLSARIELNVAYPTIMLQRGVCLMWPEKRTVLIKIVLSLKIL